MISNSLNFDSGTPPLPDPRNSLMDMRYTFQINSSITMP